ncbi:hypothetical protein FOCC_FOCC015246 [Frankliniella occidentalis]|nr:hypothetical protein FOCC_FOCC015246 [Frankliniella occidentalis]
MVSAWFVQLLRIFFFSRYVWGLHFVINRYPQLCQCRQKFVHELFAVSGLVRPCCTRSGLHLMTYLPAFWPEGTLYKEAKGGGLLSDAT